MIAYCKSAYQLEPSILKCNVFWHCHWLNHHTHLEWLLSTATLEISSNLTTEIPTNFILIIIIGQLLNVSKISQRSDRFSQRWAGTLQYLLSSFIMLKHRTLHKCENVVKISWPFVNKEILNSKLELAFEEEKVN